MRTFALLPGINPYMGIRSSAHFRRVAIVGLKAAALLGLVMLIGVKFLLAIGPGLRDFSAELPNHFELYRSSADNVTISGPGFPKPGALHITSKIVEVAYDNRFIFAKQYPLTERPIPGSLTGSNEVPDENSPRYWIIDTANSNIYGPLTREQFQEKTASLSVLSPPAMKEVDAYQSWLFRML